MAGIPVRNFATLVGNFAAGVQGRAAALVDFSVGAVLRAVAEATADLALWLQSVIVYVLTLTRAGTSEGEDLDTWYADWRFTRLPARAATTLVTASRFSADQLVSVPVGAQVATGDGSRIFEVYADPALRSYSATDNAYLLPAGTLSIVVPVQAVVPAGAANASAWNVSAGQINTARTTMEGIDLVANASPVTNGVDAESDTAFRERFPLYIASLAKATDEALGEAIVSLQQGLRYRIAQIPGLVTIAIDDGSGATPREIVALAQRAADKVRAGGVEVFVKAATPLIATVTMTITVDRAYDPPTVAGQVGNAIGAYINGLGLGAPLRFTRLDQIAYDTSPAVINVSSVRLNGATADMVPRFDQTLKAAGILVAPSR